MEIIVVQASQGDYLNFLDVFSEVEEFHRLNAPWKFKKPETELFSKEYFNDLLENDKNIFLLAKERDKIVGYIIASEVESADREILQKRKFISIEDLAIKSAYRKRGIGTTLMRAVEKLASENSIKEIELNVWTFNTNAISFYENIGFEVYSQKMRKVL